MNRKLTKALTNLGLVLASFVVILVFLEVALHFTSYRRLLLRDSQIRYYYRADAAKGFDIRPNVGKIRTSVDNGSVQYDIWSNELGCFDEPYRGEKDVILLVGDSFTHSFAPFEAKWGARLEKLLHYRVLKAGVNGYGTRQELLKAQELIAQIHRSPRLIIVGYFWNDLQDDYTFPSLTVVDGYLVVCDQKYRDPKTNRLDLKVLEKPYTLWDKLTGRYPLGFGKLVNYFLDQHLILLNLINDSLAGLLPPQTSYTNPLDFAAFQDEPWVAQVWGKHLENLKAFQELAASQGAELLIVLIPTNTQVYPFLTGGRKIDLERPNRIVSDFLRKEQIRYLDLLPLFRKYADQTPRQYLSSEKDLYWRANSHFSLKGERLTSLLVSRAILEHNLVQVPDREEKLKEIEEKLARFH
ncbi:MAG: SGNH/GDSL hydrolase family protein [Deltaproteobacteria bacterium]|nr:SGNH/GDSL hydrolase family protein [Deltaproteobacteria bacterium]